MRRRDEWPGGAACGLAVRGLAVCGAAVALAMASGVGAQEGSDEVSECEARCFDQEQACYDGCDDLACEDSCAESAEGCLESCD